MVPFYEFQPSDINVIRNMRELQYPTHIHSHIEIIYVFDKGQHINIDGENYELCTGDAAIIFPDTVHTYYRDEKRGTNQVFVICSPKLFKGVFPDFTKFKPLSPVIREIDETTALAFREVSACSEFSEQLAWTLVVLSRLMKRIVLEHSETAPVEDLTQKIITYIAQNFKNDITLDTLAKEFSVSKYYITQVFSEKIKTSFPNYLSLIRAEYAASLIRNSSDSITNICTNSGFSSQSTFNRAFKRIYCMTPREYKENIGGLYKASE